MVEWHLPAELVGWILLLARPLHGRHAWRLLPLVTGMLFASGRRTVASWLRPGGRAAICAWQAGDGALSAEAQRQVYDVCEGFFCPSLGSGEDYRSWFVDAGLAVERSYDWTNRVAQTWEICSRRVERSRVHWLARLIDRNQLMFLDRFQTILRAYRSGAMTYGCWVARKPE